MVHLVRHAPHDHVGRILTGRMPGVPLAPAGRWAAKRLADALASHRLAAVQASPRERAVETAEAIAAAHGLGVEIVPDLDEIDFGAFAGRSFADLDMDPAWQAWNTERHVARCPGGETMADAQARIVGHLRRLAERDPGAAVVAVTHADMIKAAVVHVLDLDARAIHRFDVDPASVTTLRADGDRFHLVRLNASNPGESP